MGCTLLYRHPRNRCRPKMWISEIEKEAVRGLQTPKKRVACVPIITKANLKHADLASNHSERSISTTLSGVVGKFCSGAAGGRGWCGGVVRPREGAWEGIFTILGGKWDLRSRKRRQDAGNRSQMVTGGVRGVCVALVPVSVPSPLQKPAKFTAN